MTEAPPESYQTPWPDPESGPYVLRIWNGFVDGRPAVVGIELWGREPVSLKWDEGSRKKALGQEVPITSRSVAQLRIPSFVKDRIDRDLRGAELQDAIGATAWPGPSEEDYDPESQFEATRYVRTVLENGRTKVGRPSLGDELLQQVIEVVDRAERSGDRKTNLAVWRWAESCNLNVSKSTARSWVKKARERNPQSAGGRSTKSSKEKT